MILRQPFTDLCRLGNAIRENLQNSQTDPYLAKLLKSCKKGNKNSQKELYEQFYGYAMSICLRYAHTSEEAEEIVNDGFVKVFAQLQRQRPNASFKSWIRRILINTAIDHFRKNQKHYNHLAIEYSETQRTYYSSLDNLSKQELMAMVQALPPSYRLVFNLYAIEGYSHKEIAEKLSISIGASKSNLHKARAKLKEILNYVEEDYLKRYG